MNAWFLVSTHLLCLAIGFVLGAVWCALRAGVSADDDR